MPTKRKKSSGKRTAKKKSAGRRSSTEEGSRLKEFIGAQQRAVTRFSDFAEQVADMTMRGNYTPSKWVSAYGTMWKNLAKDMADLTRAFLKD